MPIRHALIVLAPLLCSAATLKDLQAVVDQARALPPEFSADILLRTAQSPLTPDPKWQRALIEEALLVARHAPALYPHQGDPQASNRLEALTLQTRAVQALLPLDAARAYTAFRDIPPLDLPPLTCQDRYAPDVSAYYRAATELFSAHVKGADAAFLRELVSAIASPSQVVPALKLLDQVELADGARTDLMAAFAGVLDRIPENSREFAASEPLLVSAAVPEMHQHLVMPALRAYIVRQLSGARCSDLAAPGQLPPSAGQFNKLLSRIDLGGLRIAPIAGEEVVPAKIEGTFPADSAQRSPGAERAAAAIRAGHYDDALRLIEACEPNDPAAPANYAALLARDRAAVASALDFLERQYGLLADRTVWYAHLRTVFPVMRPYQELLHSTNPVIATYARLEKLPGE